MSNENVTNVVNPSQNETQKTVNETQKKIEIKPGNENNSRNTEHGNDSGNENNSRNTEHGNDSGNGNEPRNTEPENGNTEPENGNESTETGNTEPENGNESTETGNTEPENGNESTETGNTSTGNTGTEIGNTSTGNTGTEIGNTSTGNTGTGTGTGKQPTTGLGKTQGTSQSDIKELREFINKVIKPNSKLISKIHNDKVIVIIDAITTDIERLITGTKQIDLISAITNNLGTAISAGAKTLFNKYAVPKEMFAKFMKILNNGMQERDIFIAKLHNKLSSSTQPLVDTGVLLYNYKISSIGGSLTKKKRKRKKQTQNRKKYLIKRLRNTKKNEL
jgi:hypothetical protein